MRQKARDAALLGALGRFELSFERYEQLPQMLEAAVIEEARAMRSEE